MERGRFQSPPKIKELAGGNIQMPVWPELRYLKNVATEVPKDVLNLLLNLPKVDNPRIYDDIMDIALRLRGKQSSKLKPKILESIDTDLWLHVTGFANLLQYWVVEEQISDALELTETLFKFSSRVTLFSHGEFQYILDRGIRSLAQCEPQQTARILINALARRIGLEINLDADGHKEDISETWCRRLDKPENDYGPEDDDFGGSGYKNPKKQLVYAIVFACNQVYEKSPDLVEDLDNALRNHHWEIFTRLRQYLYAEWPNEQTKQWIRELILTYGNYHEREHSYEFQRMIRSACEHFGVSLLNENERRKIFDCIQRGPSKVIFQEWLGKEFTEEKYRIRKCYFHRMQFRPFEPLLFGEYKSYYVMLHDESSPKISDEKYLLHRTKSISVSKRSPCSPENLTRLTDEDLLAYINKWEEEEHLHLETEVIETDIEALTTAFRAVFKEQIIASENRLRFWMGNQERIERPAYVRTMISVMEERVKANNLDNLNEWLTFSEWVLSRPLNEHTGYYEKGRNPDESKENPDWYSSRCAVVDLVGACLENDVDVPIFASAQLTKLLDMMCTQFNQNSNRALDTDSSVAEAFIDTRSLALDMLVKFGFWLRRHKSASSATVVTAILEKCFDADSQHPLRLREYASLGRNYRWIFDLNNWWAIEHKSNFFPRRELRKWLEAFGNFVGSHGPCKATFDTLRDDYAFALANLSHFNKEQLLDEKLVDILGQRLFMYYLWEMYPLRGAESLLERYYQASDDDREKWANLFDYVGHRLWETTGQLDTNVKDKIIDFFEWRFEVREPTELQQFTYWLKAECLDPQWRLSAYSKILEISKAEDMSITVEVEALCDMLPDYTEKVVECFAKLTKDIGDNNISIFTEEATAILQAGRKSRKEGVQQNARHARENLLREGRFDLMELGD